MNVRFFLVEAVRSMRTNIAISVAAIVTVLLTVFILGAFIPSFLYVQSTVNAEKSRVDIKAYLRNDATVDEVNAFQAKIRATPNVTTVKYVSQEDALRIMRSRLKDPEILKQLPSNPLPASFEIKPNRAESAKGIIAALEGDAALLRDDTTPTGLVYGAETTDKLLSVARFIKWVGLVLISILLLASILLIGNTIRLSVFARRREVEVMKLVGATNWFIRWPFMIEGVICGIVGSILSVLLLWFAKLAIVDNWIGRNSSGLIRDQATTISFAWLAVLLVASGAVVGALGSGVTLRRFLKV